MKSYLRLYKTLHMATPNISAILQPLKEAVASKTSLEPFIWTHSLKQIFREAKSHIQNVHTLYLPHPKDQLVIQPDAARNKPGIGHTIYAVKEEKLVPVCFHSVKLKEGCKPWPPCEVEALAFAMAIKAKYNLLRESKNPPPS